MAVCFSLAWGFLLLLRVSDATATSRLQVHVSLVEKSAKSTEIEPLTLLVRRSHPR